MSVIEGMRHLNKLVRHSQREEGQAMVEYALLVSMVALACVVAVQIFGNGVANLYTHIVAVYPKG